MRPWFAIALVASACYEVGDLRSTSDASGGGQAGASASAGAASGGSSGSGGAQMDAAPDALLDAPAEDVSAEASPDAGPDAKPEAASPVGGDFVLCSALGYAGECVGTSTVIYSLGLNGCGPEPTGTCVLNVCSKIGAVCDPNGDTCSLGAACSPAMPEGGQDYCHVFGADGHCVDNVALRQKGATKDCEYKDCTALGAKCIDPPNSAADCFPL
jgi:hypothetical protein